jgi:hypothetical protein
VLLEQQGAQARYPSRGLVFPYVWRGEQSTGHSTAPWSPGQGHLPRPYSSDVQQTLIPCPAGHLGSQNEDNDSSGYFVWILDFVLNAGPTPLRHVIQTTTPPLSWEGFTGHRTHNPKKVTRPKAPWKGHPGSVCVAAGGGGWRGGNQKSSGERFYTYAGQDSLSWQSQGTGLGGALANGGGETRVRGAGELPPLPQSDGRQG